MLAPQKWELAGRVAAVDFDRFNNPEALGDHIEYTVGVNRYLHGHNLKIQGDYSLVDLRQSHGAASHDHRVRGQFQILF